MAERLDTYNKIPLLPIDVVLKSYINNLCLLLNLVAKLLYNYKFHSVLLSVSTGIVET